MLQILLFWGGLAYFGFQDATTHSVPAQPFELWCLQIYLLSIPTHVLWWAPLIWWAASHYSPTSTISVVPMPG